MENRSDGSINLKGGFITWEDLTKENKEIEHIASWKACVEKAGAFIFGRSVNRMAIASLALRACIIKHGGQMSPEDRKRTIKAFAAEIKLHEKTVGDWIRIKVNVVDKLPPEIKVIDYCAAKKAQDMLSGGDPVELYRRYASQDPGARSAMWIAHMLRSAVRHTEKYGDKKFNKHDLPKVKEYVELLYLKLCGGE